MSARPNAMMTRPTSKWTRRASTDAAQAHLFARPAHFVTRRRAIHSEQRLLPSERRKKSAGQNLIVTRGVTTEAARAEMPARWTKEPDDVEFFDHETCRLEPIEDRFCARLSPTPASSLRKAKRSSVADTD